MKTHYVLAILAALATSTLAHWRYRLQIPNGNRVPNPCQNGAVWRGVGHQSPAGANAKNPFGQDFADAGHVWTADLCRKDSDGDGLTNGQELGDPDCVWTPGAVPAKTSGLSHPGICPFDLPNCTNSWTVCPKIFNCRTANEASVAVRNFTISSNTPVPAKETSYTCQAFELNSTASPVHLIGSRPVIVTKDVLRHMIMYACDERPEQKLFDGPQECHFTIKNCLEVLIFWNGREEFDCFDQNAGYMVGGSGGFWFAVLQVQWTNPARRSGLADSSGFSLYFTGNLREYHMGTQLFGELNLVLPPRRHKVSVRHTCPATCTSFYHAETRYITSVGVRMHSHGVRGRVSLWRNGTLVRDLYPLQAYRADSPKQLRFHPPVEYLLGDEVKTECHYSTADSDVSIFHGYGSGDEMCFSYLSYYPNDVSITLSAKLARCMAVSGVNLCWLQSGIAPHVEQECNITAMINGETPNQVLSELTANSCFNRTGCDPVCRAYVNGTLWPLNACYDPRRARQMAEVMAQGKFIPNQSVALTTASSLFGLRFCEQEIKSLSAVTRDMTDPEPTSGGGSWMSERWMIVVLVSICVGSIVLLTALVTSVVKIFRPVRSYENIQ